LIEDRYIGVCIFPQCEEVLIGGAGFGCVFLYSESAGEAEMAIAPVGQF
jgi:hypothetical protein